MTPGIRTTEFWLVFAGNLITGYAAVGHNSALVQVAGIVGNALLNTVYLHKRTSLKFKHPSKK